MHGGHYCAVSYTIFCKADAVTVVFQMVNVKGHLMERSGIRLVVVSEGELRVDK